MGFFGQLFGMGGGKGAAGAGTGTTVGAGTGAATGGAMGGKSGGGAAVGGTGLASSYIPASSVIGGEMGGLATNAIGQGVRSGVSTGVNTGAEIAGDLSVWGQVKNWLNNPANKSKMRTVGRFLEGTGESLSKSEQGQGYEGQYSRNYRRGLYGGAPPPGWLAGINQYLAMMGKTGQNTQFPLD